jgi:hypothetical protein
MKADMTNFDDCEDIKSGKLNEPSSEYSVLKF